MVDYNLIEDIGLDQNATANMLREAFGERPIDEDLTAIMTKAGASIGSPNSVIKGRVVSISGDYVIVDVGLKSEGQILKEEFDDAGGVSPGDDVDVLLEEIEDQDGNIVLSKRKADRIRGWELLLQSKKEGDVVEGKVLRKIKGGLLVDI